MSSTISHQTALIYAMVIAAMADGKLQQSELTNISEIIRVLPIFHGYNHKMLAVAVEECTALCQEQDEGIDAVIGLIKEALPEILRETAYALACDIVAVDGKADQGELRWLATISDKLHINRLHAAAIERGSRARYMRLEHV